VKSSRYDIVVMPTAEADLAEIVRAIGEHSLANAESVADEIIRRIESLARFARRGARAREGGAFGIDLRQIVVLSHRVLYCVRGKTVFILRVGHGSRLRLRP
jgi:toxin ParE1/3/4